MTEKSEVSKWSDALLEAQYKICRKISEMLDGMFPLNANSSRLDLSEHIVKLAKAHADLGGESLHVDVS